MWWVKVGDVRSLVVDAIQSHSVTITGQSDSKTTRTMEVSMVRLTDSSSRSHTCDWSCGVSDPGRRMKCLCVVTVI